MKNESLHSLLAFSASPRWIPCAGSMAYPENTAEGEDGGFYANEGTAAHTLASDVLKGKFASAASAIGLKIKAGKDEFEVTEEFAAHVQTYVDDVQRRAIGGYLFTEQRVSLKDVEGFDETNYGTSDAVIGIEDNVGLALYPSYGVIVDLKFGQGERVYAWTRAEADAPFTMTYYPEGTDNDDEFEVVPNYQLMMYALASLSTLRLLLGEISGVYIVINQPRLGIISELWVPIAVLERFALFAADAKAKAELALGIGVKAVEADLKKWFKAGDKQCRWCKAQARCPALQKHLQEEMGAEFDVLDDETLKPPPVPIDVKRLSRAYRVLPLLIEWSKAVIAEVNNQVSNGTKILGPDKQPYKFVEGALGDRKWKDEAMAEVALLGTLGPKAYAPQKILTAPAAAKLIDKAATKQTWKDIFEPMIARAPGKPILALGSDSRPPYSGAAESDEFETVE